MIATWRERLALADHSKGTKNTMIQQAMVSEIGELRRALKEYPRALQRSRASAKQWRATATRYQKRLAEMLP